MANVVLTPDAGEQFRRLPKGVRRRIREAIERLEDWPIVSGVKRLTANLAGYYRMRVGDYRIRFRVVGETVILDKIGHRKDVYED